MPATIPLRDSAHLAALCPTYDHPRYTQRTVEWGNWGITFMAPQPDRAKNFGVIVAFLAFPVGMRGPCDLEQRQELKGRCMLWEQCGTLPPDAVRSVEGR